MDMFTLSSSFSYVYIHVNRFSCVCGRVIHAAFSFDDEAACFVSVFCLGLFWFVSFVPLVGCYVCLFIRSLICLFAAC